MPNSINAMLTTFIQRIKIVQLKKKIKKMESFSYLNLWDRVELRNTINLLQSLEQQLIGKERNPAIFCIQ